MPSKNLISLFHGDTQLLSNSFHILIKQKQIDIRQRARKLPSFSSNSESNDSTFFNWISNSIQSISWLFGWTWFSHQRSSNRTEILKKILVKFLYWLLKQMSKLFSSNRSTVKNLIFFSFRCINTIDHTLSATFNSSTKQNQKENVNKLQIWTTRKKHLKTMLSNDIMKKIFSCK